MEDSLKLISFNRSNRNLIFAFYYDSESKQHSAPLVLARLKLRTPQKIQFEACKLLMRTLGAALIK